MDRHGLLDFSPGCSVSMLSSYRNAADAGLRVRIAAPAFQAARRWQASRNFLVCLSSALFRRHAIWGSNGEALATHHSCSAGATTVEPHLPL